MNPAAKAEVRAAREVGKAASPSTNLSCLKPGRTTRIPVT